VTGVNQPAYLVVDTDIQKADEYEKYKALTKPIAEKYGGVYRVRGGAMDLLGSTRNHLA